jgi:DNA repair protein REV1
MGSRLNKGSEATRKRIEGHTFDDEEGEEYEGSKFGGFNEYFRKKKIKLQNLDAELRTTSNNPPIFKGIVAQVNGYTQPSLNDLHRMIVSYGGGFMQYLDGKTTVTHIIASSLTPKKAVEFKKYRIVKPAWIVDSIEAGKALPWETYRVLDEGVGQGLIAWDGDKVVSQANTRQRGYHDQTNTSWYTSQVKAIAENIDAGGGSQILSYENVSPNGAALNMAAATISRDQGRETQNETENFECKLNPTPTTASSNTESFEVSSSLEDTLKRLDNIEDVLTPQLMNGKPETHVPGIEQEAGENLISATIETMEYARPRKRSMSIGPASPSKKVKILSAEQHNALLLADPNVRKSSTANPDFLKQYYSESRLHHLSTWKADLKARLQQMAAEKSLSQKPQRLKPGSRRYIMHVDFDSFFCAVSLKSAPEYIEKPAAVAHGSGSGSEIASCNYAARKFGVKNGMWMKKALELCPDIKTLPYDFPGYEQASKGFYEAILDVGGIVQSVSVDEALVDISLLCIASGGGYDTVGSSQSSIWREQEKAEDIAENLRERIKEKTGCAVSVGIGSNILLAKIALRKAKPAGQYLLKPEEVLNFIGELTVQELPGVAYSIGGKLEDMHIKFVKDVRSLTKERLMTVLGPKTGEKIWEYSRGIDKTEVGEQVIRKSVSAEVNWGIRFINQPEAEEFVNSLCGELQKRLLDTGVKGRQLTLKIMRRATDAPMDPPKHLGHGKCDTFNKSVTLGVATNSPDIISRESISMLRSYGFSPGELRGLGVQMTKLEPINTTAGRPDGSQRRITFSTAPSKPQIRRPEVEDIDDPDSPSKPKVPAFHPAIAIARANEGDSSTTRPLNLTGTQFIMPTQFDPAILAELPQDIRTRLLAQSKSASSSRSESPAIRSRSQSPTTHPDLAPLPPQYDPEVFAALPAEMKAEVLASFPTRSAGSRAQSILPQSPRKVRALPPTKKATAVTKKRTGLLFRGRGVKADSHSTLTQSNFVTGKVSGKLANVKDEGTDSDGGDQPDLDPDFLAALPEDVRAEVLVEHRRLRLVRRSGLGLTSKPVKKPHLQDMSNLGQRKLRLPPRPAKPSFTTQNLNTLPELRETLGEWYNEFRSEGPHRDDVAAMERYLKRVVIEEKDVGKAMGVCGWVEWLTGSDELGGSKKGRDSWGKALELMKEKVQEAVRERQRGRVVF